MMPGHLYDNDDMFKHREIRKSGPPLFPLHVKQLEIEEIKKAKASIEA